MLRTQSRGATDAEIRSILRSRSGNEPINQPDLNYVNAIANAIAAAGPLSYPTMGSIAPNSPPRDYIITANTTAGQSRASTPHSPLRDNATNPIPSPVNTTYVLPSSPSFDDHLPDFRTLTINVIPPSYSISNPTSSNPTPYARSGPPSVHSTHSIGRPINPGAHSARHLKESPSTDSSVTPVVATSIISASPSSVVKHEVSPHMMHPHHQSPVAHHAKRSSRSSSIPDSIPEMESVTMALSEMSQKSDVLCQTPAEWIDNEPIPNSYRKHHNHHHHSRKYSDTFEVSSSAHVDSGLRNLSKIDKEAIAITATRVSPFKKPDFKITPHGHAHVSVNRNSIETAYWNLSNQKNQLSFSISNQLISYVYSSMVSTIQYD